MQFGMILISSSRLSTNKRTCRGLPLSIDDNRLLKIGDGGVATAFAVDVLVASICA